MSKRMLSIKKGNYQTGQSEAVKRDVGGCVYFLTLWKEKQIKEAIHFSNRQAILETPRFLEVSQVPIRR